MKEIKCVIMDWAGTAVDYGCFAPLKAFLKVFKEEKGIEITLRQAREPMGMLKIDHIRAILSMDDVRNKFSTRYNREWNETDVDEMYRSFENIFCISLRIYNSHTRRYRNDRIFTPAGYSDRLDDRIYRRHDGNRAPGCRSKRIYGRQSGYAR